VKRAARAALVVAMAAAVLADAVTSAPPANAAAGDGSPTDPNITFVGRWNTSSIPYVSNWAGAYLRTGFTGTAVGLRQRRSTELWASIDGGAFVDFPNVSGTVNLTPTRLQAGNHRLVVSYRQVAGSFHGDSVFGGLVLDPGARTFPLPVSPRLVEFVGDSITAGTTSSKLAITDYAWITGENLGAEHTQIAIGGSCLVETADGCFGMSQRFLAIDAATGSAPWDFTRYQASAVVINLGTNDVGHGVHSPQFQSTYTAFLQTIRGRYPRAAIFALETFRMRFVAPTQAAVKARNDAGDSNVFFVNTEGWIPAGGLSDSVHPNDKGHQAIAAKLAPIIAARIGLS
jgi:lysophospholipase L1-like esterase